MKKTIACALAALTFAGPLAATPAAADPPHRGDRGHDDRGRDHGRDDRGRDNRGHHNRDWRRDRSDWRDDRREARWDARHHDGYWYRDRWHYGPPPRAYYGRPGFALGYRPWARGAVLPRHYFDNRYYIDYRAHRLRRPPRGYHWVQDERGDFLLAAVATGIIADIIINAR